MDLIALRKIRLPVTSWKGWVASERFGGRTRKIGEECFQGMDGEHNPQDFGAWTFWDLVSNTERGKLAEYLVAMATG